jgi:hypothetical protein
MAPEDVLLNGAPDALLGTPEAWKSTPVQVMQLEMTNDVLDELLDCIGKKQPPQVLFGRNPVCCRANRASRARACLVYYDTTADANFFFRNFNTMGNRLTSKSSKTKRRAMNYTNWTRTARKMSGVLLGLSTTTSSQSRKSKRPRRVRIKLWSS